MNKKQYITPATKVLHIELQQMMVNSLHLDKNEANGVSDERDVLSRRGSDFWDDEE